MLVSFELYEKRMCPKSERHTLFSSAHLRYVFFAALSLAGRSPALPVPFRAAIYSIPFPISSAKVQHFFDICKFYDKKITILVHFRKSSKSNLENKQRETTSAVVSLLNCMKIWLKRQKPGVCGLAEDSASHHLQQCR